MKRYLPVLLAAAFFTGSLVQPAAAQISHIFGGGGKHYQLDAQCHRPSFAPPGISLREGLNVTGQQVWCLIRRKAKSDACIKQLGPVPPVTEKADHGVGKPGDEIGAADLRAYVADLQACVTTK